jgi:hypothetical protein
MAGEIDIAEGGEEGRFEVDETVAQRAINHTLEDVWSGQHHSLFNNNDLEEEGDEDGEIGEEEGEDVARGWKDPYGEWHDDEVESSYGLSAVDLL